MLPGIAPGIAIASFLFLRTAQVSRAQELAAEFGFEAVLVIAVKLDSL